MGTFHQDRGEFHGITVVVDTSGPVAYVGRCNMVTPEGVYFFDADRLEVEAGQDVAEAKEAWMRRAAQVGYWKKHENLHVPAAEVASIRRLGDVAG